MLRRNFELLENPLTYYGSLLLKAVSGLYPRPIRLRLRGGSYVIPVESFMTAYIYKEVFADGDYDLPLSTKEPNILDIGANTGLFALRMKQLFPDSRLFCVEPEPSNYAQLERLVSENRLQSVQLIQVAIGAKTGVSTLYLHPHNIGGHSLIQQGSDWTPSDVKLLGLQDALKAFPNGHCDLIKLDCEGAEYQILLSIDADLAPRIGCIVFEGSGHLYDVDELHEHLKSLGYSLEYRHGLTIARFSRSYTKEFATQAVAAAVPSS
jgi:FkbM family methyltransferase